MPKLKERRIIFGNARSEIYFVTSNQGKLREFNALLRTKVKSCDIDLPEIQDLHVENVALHKAMAAYAAVKKPVIVEDTGLYIRSLNDLPGALVKWFLKAQGNSGICDMVGKDRSAYIETAIAFCDGKTTKTFTGTTMGSISRTPRGDKDFGWGPIFIPEGQDKTFAEMGPVEKAKVSSRARAIAQLDKYLLSIGKSKG